MADPDSAAGGGCDQRLSRQEVVESSRDDCCAVFQWGGFCVGVVGGDALFIANTSLSRISGALDSFRKFYCRLRFLSRSAVTGHAAGGYRRGISHSYLFRRL